MKNILFIFAYKRRDLAGNTLISQKLKSYGYNSIHVNAYGIKKKIRLHKPIAVIFDHLAWDHKVEQAKFCKTLGIKVIVYNTEGFLYEKSWAHGVLGSKFSKNPHFDVVITWGNSQKEGALEFYSKSKNDVHVTGCARFDFYHPRFRKFFPSKNQFCKKNNLNPSNPIIVWATNTPYANHSYNKIVSRYVKKGKWKKDDIIGYWEVCKAQQFNHGEIVVKLAEKHPKWNFVIKVHPAEQLNYYLDIERKFENIRLGYQEGIQEYLLNCDALLQRNSTVSTEAWIANKPVIHIEDESTEYWDYTPNLLRGNIIAKNFDETEMVLTEIFNGNQPLSSDEIKYRDKLLKDYYHKLDGKSHIRIANVIIKYLKNAFNDTTVKETLTKIQIDSDSFNTFENHRLINRFKDLFKINRSISLNPKNYVKRFFQNLRGETEKLIVAEAEAEKSEIDSYYKKFDELNI